MCGICGIVDAGLAAGELRERAERMTASLLHRGPDGHGTEVYCQENGDSQLAAGYTRLAIIDLSDAGLQPMSNEDQTIQTVYNGEIYNFRELRRELETRGHTFRSHTDTEVIVHLYEEMGTACFSRLNGMFAIAIIDLRENRLILARDQLGVKPLYYSHRSGTFLFGSEIKALLASGLCPVEVDWQAVSDYFTFLYVPCPATMFAGIRQLPPAHFLTFDLASGTSSIERYWHVLRRAELENASLPELVTQARELLADSVQRQLISDVPLGVFLSGGVDSTIVAGLARDADAEIDTFTVTFPGDDLAAYDERDIARAVSRHLGTHHHELPAPAPDPVALLDLVRHFDQPFGNPTLALMHLIATQAREHITVALCGAGGDELYAGYPRYRAARLANLLAWAPGAVWRLSSAALSPLRDSYRTMGLRRAREFFDGMDPDPIASFVKWTYFFDESEKARLLAPENRAILPADRVVRAAVESSLLAGAGNRLLHADVQTFLLDNLLEYTDMMSMAAGLETRVPLLDHRFVEFSLNVPYRYKLRGRRSKILLREAFAGYFPEEARRAPKRGFNVPLARWMQSSFDGYFDAGSSVFGAGAGASWREGVIDFASVELLRDQLRRGGRDTSYQLFAVMAFDLWWRQHIARDSSLPGAPTPALHSTAV